VKWAHDAGMAKHAFAYLDGGPADGVLLELDEPEWAPLSALKVEVGEAETTYVRARQSRPKPGNPWRYIPRGSGMVEDAAAEPGTNYDPEPGSNYGADDD
jgi:hypothetical protein